MQEFYATFQANIPRTSNVFSFRFLPEKPFAFLAGQFVQVIFDEKDRSNKLLNKYLSFSSAPEKLYFELTKKISESVFSKHLLALKPGQRVFFKGPMGNCVLDERQPFLGFLVGGIGITPVISMIEHIVLKKLANNVNLLYSNWTENDIAFKSELEAWASQAKNIKIGHVLMKCPSENCEYFPGIITKEIVLKQMSDYQQRLIYVVGPPAMVTAMKELCQELEIQSERIKTENFIGY